MNKIRRRILDSIIPYKDLAEHKDLVAFVVGGECFDYDYEADMVLDTDFTEVIVAVEKEWLFDLMRSDDIDNPLDYLQNEYTSDDSFSWFQQANIECKIVMIEFN